MMFRVFILLILSVMMQEMYGRNEWFDQPIKLQPGVTLIDDYDSMLSDATIHVRASIDSKIPTFWGIAWEFKDKQNQKRAIIKLPGRLMDDDFFRKKATIRVEHIKGGAEYLLYERELDELEVDGAFNSLKMVYKNGKAQLYVGHSLQTLIGDVPFDNVGGAVVIFSDADYRCQRIQSECKSIVWRQISKLGEVDRLIEHIQKSKDPMEAAWAYLDRSLSSSKAVLGGKYVIATVFNGHNYDIIYVNGAEVNAYDWVQMRIKGKLFPTIFERNYDMEWYDTSGMLIDDDLNAEVSEDNAILTLRFPVLDSQIRFRRLNLNP